MPILDSIKNAEEKAKMLRDDAEAKVHIVLEENQIHLEMTVKEIEAAGVKAREEADKATLRTISSIQADIEKQTETAMAEITRLANERTAEAAAFLVKKVLKS